MTDTVKSGVWDDVSPLERERRRRGLTFEALGQVLGRTGKSAARYCEPPSSPRFSRPDDVAMVRIYVWSKGGITPNDFYDLPVLAPAGALKDPPAGGEAA